MVFHTNSRGQNNKQKRATRVLYRSLIALCMSIILNKYIISLVHLCVNRNFHIFRKYFILPFVSYVFREFHLYSVFRQPFLCQVWHFRYFEHPRISVHYIVRRRFDRPQAVHPEQKQTAGKIRKTGHFLRNNRLIWYARRDSNPRPFGSYPNTLSS